MADVANPPAAPADESTAPPATTEPSESTKETSEQTANASAATETNGEPKLTSDDVDKAGPQATTEVNPPDGEGKAEVDVAAATAAANDSTAASSKNSKRKSSAGVPEHKTKKLNKKKSIVNLNLDLEAGAMVWARLKGHPPWPAIVCDESMLPEPLLANRPVSTKRPDGTYREDFLEGGKNAKDRTYPVMFLSTNEFAWMVNTALTRLEPSEIDLNSEKKMQPALKDAHRIASEGHDLEHFQSLLKQHEDEVKEIEKLEREEAERKQAEKEEKAARKADKERRKSKAGDDDAMDVDEEKPSKKRKKEAESEGEGPKPKKTPKVKLSAKDPKAESTKKSKPKKKAEKVEEEDLPEPVRLERREKAIFYLRHRLQKGFLSNDTPPKEEEMETMDQFFKDLEQHTNLEGSIIRTTKIHKVLKNILRLENIPQDEKYDFKKRSQVMLDHWADALNAPADSKADAKPATNGDKKSEEPAKENGDTETKTEDKSEVKEPPEAPVEATNPGNDAGDEADVSMVDSSVVEPKADKPEETKEGAAEEMKTDGEAEKTEAPAAAEPVAA
ncbi:PWWP domain-containing protein [Elsinoe fawcettii]|nr:PWWP domain-containing protein [Elsinoe fawcettii]